jgi:hypothetical protein
VPVSAQISTSQSPLLEDKHISISEHTSNSRPVASIIISCYCCRRCRSRRAECCVVRFDLLELVEDTDLLRGRFAAGYCALGARWNWHVSVRFGKSGHLEHMETIGSIREVLGWLLAVQLDCRKMAETRKSKGSCRLLALALTDLSLIASCSWVIRAGLPAVFQVSPCRDRSRDWIRYRSRTTTCRKRASISSAFEFSER